MAITNYDLKIKKRIQLVHIAASELGILDPKRHNTDPEDDYHRILARWSRPGTRQPVTSSKEMSYEQLGELLDFFKALGFRLKRREPTGGDERRQKPTKDASWKKYPSSRDGLLQEIQDLAKARWGDGWENSLNALVRGFGVGHYKWLDISHGKAVKGAILRMNREDSDQNRRKPTKTDRADEGKSTLPQMAADDVEKDEVPF